MGKKKEKKVETPVVEIVEAVEVVAAPSNVTTHLDKDPNDPRNK